MKSSKSIHKFLFFSVAILALLLRFHHLDYESLFMDEVYQVSFYELPWSKIHIGASQQQQPPLDYWIGKLTYTISPSDFSVRTPSALFGICSVFIVMFILWKQTNPVIALVVACIYSLSPFHIYFSQEARPYSISIFFLLINCLTISWLEKKENLTFYNLFVLFFVELLFLLSRNLSPLSVVIVLNIFFFFRFSFGLFSNNKYMICRNSLYIASGVAALVVYSPILLNLINTSYRYTNHLGLLETFIRGVKHFTVFPGYVAFIVQLEPLGYLFLPFVVIACFFQFYPIKKIERINIFWLSAYLLIFSLLFHLFVFIAKGDYPNMPFRPPYPIYLQPLSLFLLAYIFHVIYIRWNNRKICMFFFFLIIIIMGFSTYQSKTIKHKTDWRGASEYVRKSLDNQNFVIFDTLSIRDTWKPYGWGFQRYDLGIPGYNIPTIMENPSALKGLKYNPVFIFFYYRDYKLLKGSPYSFIYNSGGYPQIEDDEIVDNSLLRVTHFNGLIIIELKKYSNNTIKDLYDLIKEISISLPQNNTLVDMLLLASELEVIYPTIKDENFDPLKRVYYLSTAEDFPYIKKVLTINSETQSVHRE